ncbi:uncharacterized protein LOC132605000 isoform X2 [Lycium barbarum]|uniref:uncharacterized protein LOC132605000 isoform X2 n=1 Tax=Lycium barbarum TaxID=112863 RepID=UPI00293E32F2|nr:uncharacterized protein LOC132605000 isoform X2 [Lycium barbarum]
MRWRDTERVDQRSRFIIPRLVNKIKELQENYEHVRVHLDELESLKMKYDNVDMNSLEPKEKIQLDEVESLTLQYDNLNISELIELEDSKDSIDKGELIEIQDSKDSIDKGELIELQDSKDSIDKGELIELQDSKDKGELNEFEDSKEEEDGLNEFEDTKEEKDDLNELEDSKEKGSLKEKDMTGKKKNGRCWFNRNLLWCLMVCLFVVYLSSLLEMANLKKNQMKLP